MSAARTIANSIQMANNASRYFRARNAQWESRVQAARFFWSAHRPAANQSERFYVRIEDMSLAVRPSDWCAFDEVFVRDEYRMVEKVLSDIARPRVLDLGANVGLFGARVFLYRRDAEILAVEPAPSTYSVLEQNCRSNGRYRWRALQCAVWSHDGDIGFEEARHSTSSHVLPGATLRVATRRLQRLLDDFDGAAVDLVKMDIEGAEQAVLESAGEALERIRCLIVELHPERVNAESVVGVLRETFPHLYETSRGRSRKPLLVAARSALPLRHFEGLRL